MCCARCVVANMGDEIMADLSPQQEETLESLRSNGFEQVAMKLEGLFEQIQERPGDAQITELIANMLTQYMRSDGELITPPVLDQIRKHVGLRIDATLDSMVSSAVAQADQVPGPAFDNFLGKPTAGNGFEGATVGQVGTDVNGDGVLVWVDPTQSSAPEPEAKPPLHLVPFGFIVAMARVMHEGIRGDRKAHGWKDLDAAELEEKRGALLRHYGEDEWASVATNAAILWWHGKKGTR